MISPPQLNALTISVGVNAPGILMAPCFFVSLMVSLSNEGDTINLAPFSIAFRAVVASNTVPMPTSIWSPFFTASSCTISIARGELNVTSSTLTPPSYKADAIFKTSEGSAPRRIAMILCSSMCDRTGMLRLLLYKIFPHWAEYIDQSAGFMTDDSMHYVGRDIKSITSREYFAFVADLYVENPGFYMCDLGMRMFVGSANRPFFELNFYQHYPLIPGHVLSS